ncbi:sensor domain-containing protein [Rhodococcoides corynebacterioides]|uniref:EAL domain-containing protein n=1 Tax=Rhodococcoides corynebacterioides TaxID=53972 RepID=A0ABS7P4N8_9NOCA|nr:EAL domain-containing protein [Rhodococcus corynebacterioides]MBY6367280.1 EAL domain-containing protein [Rhodococcus corynebacterioides]MBY6408823.1 EAL domain-containing protein [Rhodococcus corynebacterioides]
MAAIEQEPEDGPTALVRAVGAAVDRSPAPVLLVRADGRVVRANRAARLRLADHAASAESWTLEVPAAGIPGSPGTVRAGDTWFGRAEVALSSGERVPVSTSAFAVHDRDDDPLIVATLRTPAPTLDGPEGADDPLQAVLRASRDAVERHDLLAELSRLALRGRMDDLLAAAADTVAYLLGARLATVSRVHADPATVETVAVTGDADAAAARSGDSVPALVGETGAPILWRGDPGDDRVDADAMLGAGLGNAVAVPIDGAGRPWGVLAVFGLNVTGVGAAPGPLVAPARSSDVVPEPSILDEVADVLAAAVHRVGVERELRYRSLRDPLTGLPNRALAHDRIGSAVQRGVTAGTCTAVMLIDLDDFKSINDGLGHEAGDTALIQVSARLARASRPGDTVARLGGDEFVVVCENLRDEDDAVAAAANYADAVRAPVSVDGNDLVITASIGVAVTTTDVPVNELVRRADVAMYRAKDTGRGHLALFDRDDREHRRLQLALSADLRAALESRYLTLAYQPIFDIDTGRIAAVEALARWDHPTLGSVSPETFVAIAERTGQIDRLGLWALHSACRQAAEWQAIADIGVRVNVSALQLRQPGFVSAVARVLADTGLPVGRLGLEITETVWLADTAQVRDALTELHRMGVSILLDDLGSGHSSVTYLNRYPVIQAFKIDQSYIQAMPGKRPEAIVSAIVSLAHAFDVTVVGEGVETEAQFERLRESGCDLAQGFWLAEPTDAETMTDMLRTRRAG